MLCDTNSHRCGLILQAHPSKLEALQQAYDDLEEAAAADQQEQAQTAPEERGSGFDVRLIPFFHTIQLELYMYCSQSIMPMTCPYIPTLICHAFMMFMIYDVSFCISYQVYILEIERQIQIVAKSDGWFAR